MLELESWMDACAAAVERAFGDRVRCVGLQGSRGRGEAGPDSDIDVVLVLDVLMAEDLDRYEAVLDTLPHRELVCGFVSGWEELRRWERGDLFQLLSDTRVCRGSLDGLRELYGAPLDSALESRIFLHTAAMLERVKGGAALDITPEQEAEIQQGQEWFDQLSGLLERAFQRDFGPIPQGERYFFLLSLPERDEL